MFTLADEVTPEQWEEYGLHLIHILNDEGLAKPDGMNSVNTNWNTCVVSGPKYGELYITSVLIINHMRIKA